ncbi:RrF2 family transcriptional regulator [Shimazuella kribbensis]|uniref:RrF2 family transcriptional regulator n=1 Tax=Shimazuella kribbensis TaxID=139808 RepID=UPI0004254184|nr:Rrf2 family transcriptional regulator [Shimazuella kribbensis]
MYYSIGVEYALHCLVYLVSSVHKPIGIKDLAEFQGVSVSYLSKVFTKLAKAGIVQSTPGVKGGYLLSRPPEQITFYDVVTAIEGVQPAFQCKNIVAKGLPAQSQDTNDPTVPCRINLTMLEAEQMKNDYLKQKNLAWLKDTLEKELAPSVLEKISDFFAKC